MSLTTGGRVGLAHETFVLELRAQKAPIGPPGRIQCRFSYTWDFPRNEGQAYLEAVDGVEKNPPLPITLNAAGIAGELAFVGGDVKNSIPLAHYTLLAHTVWLVLKNGTYNASIMAGEDRNVIYSTENHGDDEAVADILQRQKY